MSLINIGPNYGPQLNRIENLLKNIGAKMATQADVDALTSLVTAQTTKLQTIDTEVKALATANPGLDISALQAAVAAQGTEVNTLGTDAAPASPNPPASA
jgi:hypothetical protein